MYPVRNDGALYMFAAFGIHCSISGLLILDGRSNTVRFVRTGMLAYLAQIGDAIRPAQR